MRAGDAAELVGTSGDWSQIVLGELNGWVYTAYLSSSGDVSWGPEMPEGSDLVIGIGTCRACNVYAAVQSSATTGTIKAGEKVSILARQSGRYLVADRGWVGCGFVDVVYAKHLRLDTDFSYDEITDDVKKRINGLSYKDNCTVPYEDLRILRLAYVDFDGQKRQGEMICNVAVAKELLVIFRELYSAGYAFTDISLVDEYDADDRASMTANNTSCFNYRTVSGSKKLSNHAYGLAVDVNPLLNPYVRGKYFSPANAGDYVDRTRAFTGKIDKNDLCYELFCLFGWQWGGNWSSEKDYQHFEKEL